MLEDDAHEESSVPDHAPLTRLEIQSVAWTQTITPEAFGSARATQSHEILTCMLSRWPGYDEMNQFTAIADPMFFLEAAGHRSIEARMAKGGMGGVDGSWGATLLVVTPELELGVGYALRPRNAKRDFLWLVADEVVVVAK